MEPTIWIADLTKPDQYAYRGTARLNGLEAECLLRQSFPLNGQTAYEFSTHLGRSTRGGRMGHRQRAQATQLLVLLCPQFAQAMAAAGFRERKEGWRSVCCVR